MRREPWKRTRAKRIDTTYFLWRVGALLWLRGNFSEPEAKEAGFIFSTKWQAYWLRHEPDEPLPEFLLKGEALNAKSSTGCLRAFVRRNGKIRREYVPETRELIAEYYPLESLKLLAPGRKGKTLAIMTEACIEAELVRFEDMSNEFSLIDALEADESRIDLKPDEAVFRERYKTKSRAIGKKLPAVCPF